jgi:hypothetical protein
MDKKMKKIEKREVNGASTTTPVPHPPNCQFPLSTHQCNIDGGVDILQCLHRCVPTLAMQLHVGVYCVCNRMPRKEKEPLQCIKN